MWNPVRFRPRNHFQFFETQRVFRRHRRTVDACPRAEAADHRTYANRFGRAIATRVASRVAASRLADTLEFATLQFPTHLHNFCTACCLDKTLARRTLCIHGAGRRESGKTPGPNWLGRGSRAKGDQERTGSPRAGPPERESRRNERMNNPRVMRVESALDRGGADGASRRGTRPGVLKETSGGCSPRAGDRHATTVVSYGCGASRRPSRNGRAARAPRPLPVDGAGERNPIKLNEGMRPAGLIPSLICAVPLPLLARSRFHD